jgi:hypothetical protein
MPSTITTMITTNEMTTQRRTQPHKDERDNHTKTKHQTQTDKRNSTQKHQIIEPIMATASSQRVLANQGACQTTKGANAT